MSILSFRFLLLFFVSTAQAEIIGNIEMLERQGNQVSVVGWACLKGSGQTIHLRLTTGTSRPSSFNLNIGSTGLASGPETGSLCGTLFSNYRFKISIPQDTQDPSVGKKVFVKAGISTTGPWTSINNPNNLTIPIWGDGTTASWPLGNRWSPEPTNYFSKWSCKSSRGLKTISRLFISPLTTHSPTYWKDSLVTNKDSNGNIVIFFTTGDYGQPEQPPFKMSKAKFNGSDWVINQYLVDYNPGGVSSHDGTENHYIFNKYFFPGWGPYASTSTGKIPGVDSATNDLWGSGPLGLTTIKSLIQNNISNLDTCLHMNPSLSDYDPQGIPRSFIATLWSGRLTTPCSLPVGAPLLRLPKSGPYLYRYVDSSMGWQLDLNTGLVENQRGLDYAMNADPLKKGTYTRADVTAGIMEINAIAKTKKTVINCSSLKVHFAEASRGLNGAYYFVADEKPFAGPGLGLSPQNGYIPPTPHHDIFVAY